MRRPLSTSNLKSLCQGALGILEGFDMLMRGNIEWPMEKQTFLGLCFPLKGNFLIILCVPLKKCCFEAQLFLFPWTLIFQVIFAKNSRIRWALSFHCPVSQPVHEAPWQHGRLNLGPCKAFHCDLSALEHLDSI